MRIERIRGVNLLGLDNIDWTLPEGAVAIFVKCEGSQAIHNLLFEFFYANISDSLPMSENHQGLIEMWMSGDSSSYHISHSFIENDASTDNIPTWFIEDENGEVSLPNAMRLGEYLFGISVQAFQQGGIVIWPNLNEEGEFSRRVRNLRHGGDEKFSLAKVRASITGAQKKVNEQAGSMLLVKSEYDALRRDWEIAHRQQEEKRSLMIELKNLQEREKIINDGIAAAAKLEERLAILAQNSDYRELRRLQGEVTRLEELCCESETKLMKLTQDSQVDWSMIESLREECMEWAKVEEQAEKIRKRVDKRTAKINGLETYLASSGYQELDEGAEQRLNRAEQDRMSAQKELEELIDIKQDIENMQEKLSDERAQLEDFAIMTNVTKVEEIRYAKKEQHLQHWRNSKIAGFVDRVGHNLGVSGIEDRLSLRLKQDYQSYQVSNYKEFKIKLNNYRKQQQRVEHVQNELAKLQEIARREKKLQRIVISCTEILNHAFNAVNTENLAEWQNGWRNFRQKKQQWTIELETLHLELDELTIQENLAAAYAEQLRNKIGDWGIFTTNRDQVLAEVLKVARQMRIQEEANRELAIYTQRFEDALGNRNIEQLAKILEPLAELEREISVSDEERQAGLANINTEKLENQQQQAALEQRLRGSQNHTPLSVLEKKIEKAKQQWLAYEDLNNALQDVQASLEVSWHEWQTKCGKELEREAEWIYGKIFSFSAQGIYFAYRMAVAQLALGTSEVPLFFIVEEKTEDENYWKDILKYLQLLADSRQVILITSDLDLWQRVKKSNWQII